MHTHYIPSNGWTVYISCVLLWFGSDQFYPYSSGLLQWQWRYHTEMLKCWKIPKKMDCRVRLRKGFVTKTLLAYLTSRLHAAQDRVWYVHDPHAYSDIKTHNLLGSWLNILPYFHIHMNTLWQQRKCNHFADGSFKCISFNERAVLFGLKSYCTWFQWVQLINIPPPPPPRHILSIHSGILTPIWFYDWKTQFN